MKQNFLMSFIDMTVILLDVEIRNVDTFIKLLHKSSKIGIKRRFSPRKKANS